MTLRSRLTRAEKRIPANASEETQAALAKLLAHPAVAADGAGPMERVAAIAAILDREQYRRSTLTIAEFRSRPLAERLEYLQLNLQRPADVPAATEAIRRRMAAEAERTATS